MVDSLNKLIEQDLDHILGALRDELAELAGSRLLVTGGGGFLGYYLVLTVMRWNDRNAADRIDVTVFDTNTDASWLRSAHGRDDLVVLDHDVTWPLPEAPTRFDYVMHAAGIASPTRYRASPLEAVDATVGGVRNLLERGRELAESNAGMRALLYFSSSEVYGDPLSDNIPTPETYHGNVSCLGPRACYDESKRLGETLCAIFSRSYGVPAKIVRPFNNYGPGQRLEDGRVLSDFAGDVLDSRDIVVLSDGRPTRTFCYVADAVIGYYRALVRGRPGEAYNIGMDGPEISIDAVAERVATAARDLFAYRGRVVRGQPTDADYLVDTPQRRCPDITKARIELGFAPSIGLDDGLRRALTWWADVRDRVAV